MYPAGGLTHCTLGVFFAHKHSSVQLRREGPLLAAPWHGIGRVVGVYAAVFDTSFGLVENRNRC